MLNFEEQVRLAINIINAKVDVVKSVNLTDKGVNGVYVYENCRGGKSIIVDEKGEALGGTSSKSLDKLIEEYKSGVRSKINPIIKRVRARAVIIDNGKLVSMYRDAYGRIFYTFPGGGMEANETEEQCVVREVLEEFGLNVEPIKKLYVYENEKSLEHFYLCKWVGGEFGTGVGEEFEADRNKGIYKPMFINIADVPNLPLMPPEVAKCFYEDYIAYGEKLSDEIKYIK